MAITADRVCEHLVELRSGLVENRWSSRVDQPVVAVFSELLTSARRLAPGDLVLGAIERPTAYVRPATLMMLIDQILLVLEAQVGAARAQANANDYGFRS